MKGNDLKEVVKSLGPQGFLDMINKGLKAEKGPEKLVPEDFSIQELWRAVTNDAPLGDRYTADDFTMWKEEAIREDLVGMGSTLFAKATGALINKKVRDAFDATPGIGDRLVTVIPSSMIEETIVGFTNMDLVSEVRELQAYPQTGMQELYFTVTNKKYGIIISISEETVKFDQTSQILNRCARIGERAKLFKEKTIVEGVVGPAVNSATNSIFKPFNSAQIPYSTTARTTLVAGGTGGANAATGHADINHASLQAISTLAMEQYAEAGTDDKVNLAMQGWILLCPWELYDEAWEVTNTSKTPFTADNAENFWMQFRFIPVSSPFLTTATTWLLGDFKKDFILTEVFPLQVQQLKSGTEVEFTKDLLTAYKVRWMGGIGQISYHHSYKVE